MQIARKLNVQAVIRRVQQAPVCDWCCNVGTFWNLGVSLEAETSFAEGGQNKSSVNIIYYITLCRN
jgi:hypothetical protein